MSSCVRVLDKLAPRVVSLHLNQDKFQTFVCYVLLFIAILPTILYLIIVFDNIQDSGCQGTRFTVLSQYSTWEWMNYTFNEFKSYQAQRRAYGELTTEICYDLILSSNPFKDTQPVLYQPDYNFWLEAAQLERGESWISNKTALCRSMTLIPFGIVTWDFIAADYPNQTITYKDLEFLVLNKTLVFQSRPLTKFFIHGHVNVTSGGQMGIITGIQSKGGQVPDHVEYVHPLEKRMYRPVDIDLETLDSMALHGPTFAIATFGFENEMIYMNKRMKQDYYQTNRDWAGENSLAFLYLNETYWMEHPLCKLDTAPWVTSEELEVADDFMKFIDNTLFSQTKLMRYGIRPYNDSVVLDPKIFNTEHGVNRNVTAQTSTSLPTIAFDNVMTMTREWQDIKRPVFVQLLVDVSSGLTKTVGQDKNRWFYLKKALPVFGEVLEDYAVINITCFSSKIVPCAGEEIYNHNLTALYSTRDDYIDYVENSLITSSKKQRALFESLVQIYQALNDTKNYYKTQSWAYYSFALVIISQTDNTRYNEVANDFIWHFPTPVQTDGIVIHSILYFGQETSATGLALGKIAALTEGQFSTATEDLDEVVRELTYFF